MNSKSLKRLKMNTRAMEIVFSQEIWTQDRVTIFYIIKILRIK